MSVVRGTGDSVVMARFSERGDWVAINSTDITRQDIDRAAEQMAQYRPNDLEDRLATRLCSKNTHKYAVIIGRHPLDDSGHYYCPACLAEENRKLRMENATLQAELNAADNKYEIPF